jgi:hypothetical protein
LGITADWTREKLGWLQGYRAALGEWSGYQALIDGTLDFVRRRGLYAGAGFDLAAALPPAPGSAGELREELIHFVPCESLKARPGERLPGTTEVLESCFGKLKALEDGQSKSGFTGLVLSLGAMVSDWTAEAIGEALERCRIRDVAEWCRKIFGTIRPIPAEAGLQSAEWRNRTRMIAPGRARPTSHRARARLRPSRRRCIRRVGVGWSDAGSDGVPPD